MQQLAWGGGLFSASMSDGGYMKWVAEFTLKNGDKIQCLRETFTPKKSDFDYGKPDTWFSIADNEDLEFKNEKLLLDYLRALDENVPMVYFTVNGIPCILKHPTPELLEQLQQAVEESRPTLTVSR